MTVAEAIVARLKSLSAVTNLVGQRVYTLKFPNNHKVWPSIRVQVIDDVGGTHLRGGVKNKQARVQIDCVAKDNGVDYYASARNVDEAVMGPGDGTGLWGFQGLVGSFPIESIEDRGKREFFDAEELDLFRIVREVMVSHKG